MEKSGFELRRQKGSHAFYFRESDKRATVVPIHNKDIGRGLLRKILNEIDMGVGEFIGLMGKK